MRKKYPGGSLFVISWILGLLVMTVRAGVIVPGLDDSMAILITHSPVMESSMKCLT